jgi:hypothetical protein
VRVLLLREAAEGPDVKHRHLHARDVPHPERKRDRVTRPDGSSFPTNKTGEEPRRPVISMLFEDLGELSQAERVCPVRPAGDFNAARTGEPKRPVFMAMFPDVADPEDMPAGVLGMYPASFIPRILPWLKCERREVLHVCSGGLPPGEGIRVDIRPEAKPDILADGRALPLPDGSQAAVLLDPPYTEHYAKDLYGTDYPRPAHLLAEAARVVRPNGRIGFVHYIVPNAPRGCAFIKAFGLSMGFGYPMRAVTIFERQQDSMFGGGLEAMNDNAFEGAMAHG